MVFLQGISPKSFKEGNDPFTLPSGNKLLHLLQDISGEVGSHASSWFNKWRVSKITLDYDFIRINKLYGRSLSWRALAFIEKHFTRYFGVPLRDIEKMMLKFTPSQIAEELGTTSAILCSKLPESFIKLQKDIRNNVAIELLSKGINPMRIVTLTFGLYGEYRSQVKQVMERVFDIPYQKIMDTNWALYVEKNNIYWVDFLGLIEGIDY